MSLTEDEYNPKPVKIAEGTEVQPGIIDIGSPASWKVTQRSCPPGQHHMIVDETETEFEAEKCDKCHIGRLIRRKTSPSI
jgi:hypothetical protein